MVLFLGELLIDFITNKTFKNAENYILKIGGSPGNIAKYLSMLGIPTKILSRVGNDPLGEKIQDNLRRFNVDISYIQTDDIYGTSIVFVQKTSNTPDFFVIRGADRFYEIPSSEIFNDVKILHLSCWPISHKDNFKKTLSVIEQAVQRGIKISFDPNCRDKLFDCRKISLERVKEILSISYYTKPSLDDAISIFGELDNERYTLEDKARYYIEKFKELGVKNVVLTAGKDGAFVFSDNVYRYEELRIPNDIIHIPSQAKKVVDATGAGDGFWAGIYYGILNGKSFMDACIIGSKIAAHILKFVGADVPISINILEG
ncbi:MAG: carbohydrate kinase family protein [Fervidobacterium sp.]